MTARGPVPTGTLTLRELDATVVVELRRSARRRTLELAVRPDRGIVVTAPVDLPLREIQQHLRKKLGWIRSQRRRLAELGDAGPEKHWASGETHRYLGRQYRLRVRPADRPSVKLVGRFFQVRVSDPADRRAVEDVMHTWFREHARRAFERRLDVCHDRAARLQIERPPLVVRSMRTRWGSCTPSRRLLLNLELVRLPISIVDYVIFHELCHLRIANHGPAFWQLLGSILPDWRRRRERLARIPL